MKNVKNSPETGLSALGDSKSNSITPASIFNMYRYQISNILVILITEFTNKRVLKLIALVWKARVVHEIGR